MVYVTIKPKAKFHGIGVNRHKYWIISNANGKTLHVEDSMTEAINRVEKEGYVFKPD